MRIKNIYAESFGCLKNWKSPELDGNMVVVYGRNESGKTTLFRMISTLLYGWNPVSNNPAIPWNGDFANCSGELLDKQDRNIYIYRKLKSKPEGTMVDGNVKTDLANRPIPMASHVPYDIFSEVFALSIDELCLPHSGTWQGIQDQLLGGQFIRLFNPVAQIAAELKDESGSLWRHNRQGNAKDKQLSMQYSELKLKLQDTVKNDEAIRRIEAESLEIDDNIKSISEKKIGCMEYINRYERLYPVYKRLDKIKKLSLTAGDIEKYSMIPDNIENVLSDIESSIAELKNEKEYNLECRKKFGQIMDLFNSLDKAIYSRRDDISVLSKSYMKIEGDLKASEGLKLDIAKLEERIKIKAAELLQHGWNPGIAPIISEVDEGELKSAILEYKSENAKYGQQEALVSNLKIKVKASKMSPAIPVISSLMMTAGFVGMLFLKGTQSGLISGIFSLLGGCLMILYLFLRKNKYDMIELKDAEKKLSRISSDIEYSKERIKHCLSGLDIRQDRLDRPDEMLYADMTSLKEIQCSIDKNKMLKRAADDSLRDIEFMVLSLTSEIEVPFTEGLMEKIKYLEDSLKQSEKHLREASSAEDRIDDIDRKISGVNDKIKELEKKYELLKDSLNGIEGSSIDEKITNLKERRRNRQLMLSMKDELEHDYPDLEDIIEEIKKEEAAGAQWSIDDEKIARVRIELEEIDKNINSMNEKKGSLKKELEQRNSMESPDEIKSCLMDIENEKKLVAVKRDRLMLLRNILLKAERMYRDENQPDVLLQTGRYMDIITGSRYNKIYTGEGDNSISIMPAYRDMPLDVEKVNLSRGTKEQIYLALRMALISHLDGDGKRLPLFFDELFINWDCMRMDSTISLINEIKKQRQVFMFTCHKEMADMFLQKCGAQVIEL